MKTYVATQNLGKLRELKTLFTKSPLQIVTPRKRIELDVVESAPTYAGNALLKATALAQVLRERHVAAAVLADDSGLEIDALAGRPGIHSARYGGPDMAWPMRRTALLAEMRGVPPYRRGARFVCALVLIEPNREPVTTVGEVRGYILESESGTGGFGYDCIFLYPPLGRSFAALSEQQKNSVSHRRAAADALLTLLRERTVSVSSEPLDKFRTSFFEE